VRQTHVGPWTTEGTTRLIGVVLFVNLARPADVTGTWPTTTYDPSERTFPPYTEERRNFTATGLRSVLIEVDLRRRAVAGVTPAELHLNHPMSARGELHLTQEGRAFRMRGTLRIAICAIAVTVCCMMPAGASKL
jgi:hypothetical protein